MENQLKIRALEKKDLEFIHFLNNEKQIMSYWFEEYYESLDELTYLYEKHIRDDSERRFIAEIDGKLIGVVELVEINYIHRNCEIQIIVIKDFQGLGHAKQMMMYAINYAFNVLNLHKIFLYVDYENEKAIKLYDKLGFVKEGVMKEQFYINGLYRDSFFMSLLKKNCKINEKPISTAQI